MPRGGKRPNSGRKQQEVKRLSHGMKFSQDEWDYIGEGAMLRGFKTTTDKAKRQAYIMWLAEKDRKQI